MPIYAYRCTSCGHAKDVLQKISEPALTQCPACGAATFAKQVTAAGFQLKGSGWYATDFKNTGAGAKKPGDAAAEGKPGDGKSAEATKTDGGDGGGKGGDNGGKSGDSSASTTTAPSPPAGGESKAAAGDARA